MIWKFDNINIHFRRETNQKQMFGFSYLHVIMTILTSTLVEATKKKKKYLYRYSLVLKN